jgi:aflatoxin B1 aldehyde reductase
MLTGKHKDLDSVAKGRFRENQNYLPRFYTAANFEALNLIQSECDKHNLSMVEATFRWLLCHSALDSTSDGFLLGASSVQQLDENLQACRAAATSDKPLPATVLEAFDRGWELTRGGAFKYWRSYSLDMPGREDLDQGASYDATKTKK